MIWLEIEEGGLPGIGLLGGPPGFDAWQRMVHGTSIRGWRDGEI